MTTDQEKQADFIAALRKKAEELAAHNPVVAEVRSVGKALAAETRKRIADGKPFARLGSCRTPQGEVSLIEAEATDPAEAEAEILLKLRRLAQEKKISAAGICEVVEQPSEGARTQFMSLHLEHSSGAALRSLIPVDESLLLAPVPGVQGPAVAVSSGKTQPRIFPQQPKPMDPNAPVLKIAVMADGRITVDGSPATIDSLRAALKRLAEAKGVVWYYREAGQTKAPPESAEVMKAVIENRLPIRLSSRPDYSDSIGLDGKPIPKSQIQ